MKKTLLTFVYTLLLLLCFLPFETHAETLTYTPEGASYGLEYEELEDGSLSITGYTGAASGELLLPESIDGKPVSTIGALAFYQAIGFTSDLIIPDTVISICSRAFYGCTGFNGTLTLSQNLTSIDNEAFYQCSGFTGDLLLPDTVTELDYSAFAYCSGFDGVLTLSESLTVLPNSAFYSCSGLTGALKIPDSVTTIESAVFQGCSSLNGTLDLGNSLVTIGNSAFRGCASLIGDLCIPQSVTTLHNYAFQNCTSLNGTLTISETLTKIPEYAFYGCSGLTGQLIIPDSITAIGQYAFQNCSGFTGSLTLPDTVTSVGKYAFADCSGFNGTLHLSSALTALPERVFQNCSGLTGILNLPDSLFTLGSYAFGNCSGFSGDLMLPNSITSLGVGTFSGCTGFNGALTIGSGLSELPISVFSGCSGLSGALMIPQNITTIGWGAFTKCSSFTGDLIIPDSVTKINGDTSIGSGVFSYCTGFDGKLSIGSGISELPNYLFYGCSGLTGDLTIPDTITTLGKSVFNGCTDLDGTLSIGSGVSTLPSGLFYNCSGLTGDLIIPDTVTSAESDVFYNCSGLTGTLSIGNGLTEIPNGLFQNCSGLTGDLVIPDTIASIGENVFKGCTGFTGDLVIGDGITEITKEMFSGCSVAGTLILGDGVSTIESEAFAGFPFTGDLVIPDNVTSIGASAFEGCSSFTGSLYLGSGLTTIAESTFSGCSGFTEKLLIPDNITSMERSAFYGCSGLNIVVIPSSVTAIYPYTFYNCTGLTRIALPASLTNIFGYAFHTLGADTLPTIYYAGSEDAWNTITVASNNNMITADNLHFQSTGDAPLIQPEGDVQVGTVTACADTFITIDAKDYALASGLTVSPDEYLNQVVKYIVSEEEIIYIEVLTRSTGILTDWYPVLSDYAKVVIGGTAYDLYPTYGVQDFTEYADILIMQQVVYYHDDDRIVYRIAPMPDTTLYWAGQVSYVTEDALYIRGARVSTAHLTVEESTYLGSYILVSLLNGNEAASITLLASDIGTLSAFSESSGKATISAEAFTLSPYVFITPEELSALEGCMVRYVFDADGGLYFAEQALPDESVFVEELYRAGFWSDFSNTPAKTLRDILKLETSGEIFRDVMQDNGFLDAVAVWEGVSFVPDALISISNVEDANFMPEDLYSAIILEMLKDSSNDAVIGTLKKHYGTINSLSSYANSYINFELTEQLDLTLPSHYSTLTAAQRQALAGQISTQYFQENPGRRYVKDTAEILKIINYAFVVGETVEDALYKAEAAIVLYNMSDSLKDVIYTMLTEAQLNAYSPELQAALTECLEIINTTDSTQCAIEAIQDMTQVAGETAHNLLLSHYWSQLFSNCPSSIKLARAVIGSTKLACDLAWNTDGLAAQTWELLATLEVEHLVEDACMALYTEYSRTHSVEDAAAFLSAYTAVLDARDQDCASVLKYVSAVDNALISKALEQTKSLIDKHYGVETESFSQSLRDSVTTIRNTYLAQKDMLAVAWINYLDEDFPGQGLENIYLQACADAPIHSELTVACPVNVYLYDENDQLLAYVADGRTYASGNVSVMLDGDVKTFYLYDDASYYLDCQGTDTGTMDVALTQYIEDGTCQRQNFFWELPVTLDAVYSAHLPASAPGTIALTGPDEQQVIPHLDTDADSETYTYSIVNGSFALEPGLSSSITASAYQQVSIQALLPTGYVFTGWSSSDPDIVFTNPHAKNTTVRLSAGDATITANYTVVGVSLQTITLNRSLLSLAPGQTYTLQASPALPLAPVSVKWSSLDPNVATVDQNGLVTAVSPGTTCILATSSGNQVSCTVIVRDYSSVSLEILDTDGTVLSAIPSSGSFQVRATIPNGTHATTDFCLLAVYSTEGQMTEVLSPASYQLLEDDSTMTLYFTVANANNNAASLKLFILSSDARLQPYTESISYLQ